VATLQLRMWPCRLKGHYEPNLAAGSTTRVGTEYNFITPNTVEEPVDLNGDTVPETVPVADVVQVTCLMPPTPTPTPTNTRTPAGTRTPTATGTPPTATPTSLTATPITGPTESVTLVENSCNPVASTYPDGTAIDTIVSAVSPPTILISSWLFDPDTSSWLAYSPQFPQASNLTTVNQLDVIFICVSSAGAWDRPQV